LALNGETFAGLIQGDPQVDGYSSFSSTFHIPILRPYHYRPPNSVEFRFNV
jgi:hypothetical protein